MHLNALHIHMAYYPYPFLFSIAQSFLIYSMVLIFQGLKKSVGLSARTLRRTIFGLVCLNRDNKKGLIVWPRVRVGHIKTKLYSKLTLIEGWR